MLRLITDKREIEDCQNKLESQLKKRLPYKEELDIGFQGGKITNDVFYSDGLWYSTSILDDADFPRYWNAFGLGKRDDGNQTIIVEINSPLEGRTRQVAGLFAKDDLTNEYFILHKGKIGGGREGIGKNKFKNWYLGKWVEVFDDQVGSEEAILISSIASKNLVSKLTDFVREVAEFKDDVTNLKNRRSVKNIEESLSFNPEFYGKKSGKRTSKFEYESNHGLIVNALEKWVQKNLKSNQKTFNNSLVDLAVSNGNKTLMIYEVKTRSDSQSIYTGIGQLMFHSGGDDRITKFLVIPKGAYEHQFLSILKALKIKLIQYLFNGDEIEFIA